MRRLTKDEYFLAISGIVAARATCDRLWAGCVLVKNGIIVSTGYNGAPSGLAECDEVGHLMVLGDDDRPHCKRTIHAELNAINQAVQTMPNLRGVTAYINATPCEICLTELLKYDVKRLVCGSVYRNVERAEVFSRLTAAFGAILEYKPMPDISIIFNDIEPTDVKRIVISRPNKN
jgi:dCMP deaminase